MRARLATILACLGMVSCDGADMVDADTADDPGDGGSAAGDYETDPLADLPTGQEQWQTLCSRGYDDDVSRAFCTPSSPPVVDSLIALQRLLGLNTSDPRLGAHSS
jgi:hypothetical protein